MEIRTKYKIGDKVWYIEKFTLKNKKQRSNLRRFLFIGNYVINLLLVHLLDKRLRKNHNRYKHQRRLRIRFRLQ